jgi:adenosine/AMP kinase
MLFVGGLLVAANANASTARLRVVGQDKIVKYNCQFSVSTVNGGTVNGTLSGNAFPASLFGYGTIASNEIICALYDANGNPVAVLDQKVNRASVSGSEAITVPLSPSYGLCGSAKAVTKNGTTDVAPTTCATG